MNNFLKVICIFLACVTVIGVLLNTRVPTVENTKLAFDNLSDESEKLVEDVGSFQVLYHVFMTVLMGSEPIKTEMYRYGSSYYLQVSEVTDDEDVILADIYLSDDYDTALALYDKMLLPSKPAIKAQNTINSIINPLPDAVSIWLRPFIVMVTTFLVQFGLIIGLLAVVFDALKLVVELVVFVFTVIGITRPAPR